MVRLDRIYTRGGDDGMTSLGDGERVSKDDARIWAYGTVDETGAAIGVAVATGLEPSAVAWGTRVTTITSQGWQLVNSPLCA